MEEKSPWGRKLQTMMLQVWNLGFQVNRNMVKLSCVCSTVVNRAIAYPQAV